MAGAPDIEPFAHIVVMDFVVGDGDDGWCCDVMTLFGSPFMANPDW